MALVLPVISNMLLAAPLPVGGTLLPLSLAAAATLCARLNGGYTFLRLSSPLGIEVVRASCSGAAVVLVRAQAGTAAIAHPVGGCANIEMQAECVVRDWLCTLLPQCNNLVPLVTQGLLDDDDFLRGLTSSAVFINGLLANTAFTTTLMSNPAVFSTVVTNPAFISLVTNQVLNAPDFAGAVCSAVAATCPGGGGGTTPCANPVLTVGLSATTATVGVPFSATFTVTPASSVNVLGAPSWLTTSFNTATDQATIAGTPTASGTLALQVTATNACGTGVAGTMAAVALAPITVGASTVCPAPTVVAMLAPATATVGVPFSGTAQFGNTTAVSFPGLPSWMAPPVFNPGTGVTSFAGTPTATAIVAIVANLTNNCGGGMATTIQNNLLVGSLNVAAATCPQPSIVSALSPATTTAGVAYTGTVGMANATAIAAAGLPSWMGAPVLDISFQTATFTGTPVATGTVGTITLTATNACGSGPTSSMPATSVGSLSVTTPAAPASGGLTVDCGVLGWLGTSASWAAVAGASSYDVEWYTGAPTSGGTIQPQPWADLVNVPGASITFSSAIYPAPQEVLDDGINPPVVIGSRGHVRVRGVGTWGVTAWLELGVLNPAVCPDTPP